MGTRPSGVNLKIVTCQRENKKRRRAAGRVSHPPRGWVLQKPWSVCERRGHSKMRGTESEQVTVSDVCGAVPGSCQAQGFLPVTQLTKQTRPKPSSPRLLSSPQVLLGE